MKLILYKIGILGFLASLVFLVAYTKTKRHRLDLHLQNSEIFDLKKDLDNINLEFAYPYNEIICLTGEKRNVLLKINYTGSKQAFSSLQPEIGRERLNLGYFLVSENDETIEGRHQTMRLNLHPSKKNFNTILSIECPEKPSVYKLQVELVQEQKAWQHDVDDKKILTTVLLAEEPDSSEAVVHEFYNPNPDYAEKLETYSDSQIKRIGKVYRMALRILGYNANLFQFQRNIFHAFEAGTIYPMVWVRDMATIQQAFRYLKPKIQSNYWQDLFFINQRVDGNIPDWVSAKGGDGVNVGRNNAAADQEAWLAISSFEAIRHRLYPKNWLNEKLSTGKTRLEHIEFALKYPLSRRFFMPLSCIISPHTADWGDVGLLGKDSATSTEFWPESKKVCGLFNQIVFTRALKLLRRYHPKTTVADHTKYSLSQLIARLENFIQDQWLDDKGYFRMHHHIDKVDLGIDEDSMFALGANTFAMLYGYTTKEQDERIIKTIRARQWRFKVSTLSATLLPSFPVGTYQNPIMDEKYEYQNGGQWDWFGLRAVIAIAKRDYPLARRKFMQIVRKILSNRDFYEWDTLKGQGKGSPRFRTGAATYIWAVHQLNRLEDR